MRRRLLLLALLALIASSRSLGETRQPSWEFFAFCMDTHDSEKRSLAEQARLLKELGYDGAGHLWLNGVSERLASLDEQGLSLFQIYLRVNLKKDAEPYDAALKQALPLLKGRSTMLALLVAGMPPSDPAGDARAVAIVGEIADLAADHGVRVALYPHANDWLETVEDGLRITEKLNRPNVGVMFNLCHWAKVDEASNLEPLLRRARPHLMAVSIHGADTPAEIKAGTGRWIRPLGQGSFDVSKLLQVLRAMEYDGPIGLQCYGLEGDARVHLEASMRAWRRALQEF